MQRREKTSPFVAQQKSANMAQKTVKFVAAYTISWLIPIVVILAQLSALEAIADINLKTSPSHFQEIYAAKADMRLGVAAMGTVGDLNGDDFADVIIASPYDDASPTRTDSGSATVVFGRSGKSTTAIDSANMSPSEGIRINGTQTGASYIGLGTVDLNKDGFDDLLYGESAVAYSGRTKSGAVRVIFGKATGWTGMDLSTFDLATSSAGFSIYGAETNDNIGKVVEGAGDFNNDGNPDILIGAEDLDRNSVYNFGYAYLILGKGTSTTFDDIDLASFSSSSTTGIIFKGSQQNDKCGGGLSTAGDFNDDGFDDILIGCSGSSITKSIYLVYGRTSTTAAFVDTTLSSLSSSQGFSISNTAGSGMGINLRAAGDVNDDGIADIIFGAFLSSCTGASYCGTTYVIFGHKTGPFPDLDLTTFSSGPAGFKVIGSSNLNLGQSNDGGGDLNNDGIDDVVVSARGDTSETGAVFAIFGQSNSTYTFTDVDTSSLNSLQGFKVSGVKTGDKIGAYVAIIDFNNDGVSEIIGGASDSDPLGRNSAGSIFVVYVEDGSAAPTTVPTVRPTLTPSVEPSAAPTQVPTSAPTQTPSAEPSFVPTSAPTAPTLIPSPSPTDSPTQAPSADPTQSPSASPTKTPTTHPSVTPSLRPSTRPTTAPTLAPSNVFQSSGGTGSSSSSGQSIGMGVGIGVGLGIIGWGAYSLASSGTSAGSGNAGGAAASRV